MKTKNLMTLKAIVCLVFGLPMLLIPGHLMAIYGLDLALEGTVMARLYGGSLLGNMLLTWFARKDSGSISLHAAVLYLFVYDGLNFGVTLWATVAGIMSVMGWSAVLIYLFFTVGFGLSLFRSADIKHGLKPTTHKTAI